MISAFILDFGIVHSCIYICMSTYVCMYVCLALCMCMHGCTAEATPLVYRNAYVCECSYLHLIETHLMRASIHLFTVILKLFIHK